MRGVGWPAPWTLHFPYKPSPIYIASLYMQVALIAVICCAGPIYLVSADGGGCRCKHVVAAPISHTDQR